MLYYSSIAIWPKPRSPCAVMTFIWKDLMKPLPAMIVSFLATSPSAQFTSFAATSQDCHALWRKLVLATAREMYVGLIAAHDRMAERMALESHVVRGHLGELMLSLQDIADILCLDQ